MPRKGRLVQPRHIFPWVAAPYIEMLRLLWRIERFFFMPIRYLQAWTVSAIFGVLGVLFSIALFIPRLAENSVHASPDTHRRPMISRYDMPFIPEEDLVLPEGYTSGASDLSIRMHRTRLEDFDQNEIVFTQSKPAVVRIPRIAKRDGWDRYRDLPEETEEAPLQSYLTRARIWDSHSIPLVPEYTYDPGIGDYRTQMEKTTSLLIKKSVPQVHAPDEPLTYRITVTNVGQEPVASAIVKEAVSDMKRVVDCDPPAMISADYGNLVWDLAELRPNETRHLSVTIQPNKRRPINQETLVEFMSAAVVGETMIRETVRKPVELPEEPEPEPVRTVPEPVARPSLPGRPRLVLEFEPPNVVKVGEEIQAYYTITNVGTADATGIRLLVEVPKELRHRFGELVEHKIRRLAPNESRRALFAALTEGSGRLPLNWTLEADILESQSNTESLVVLPGPNPTPPAVDRPKSSIPASEPTPIDSDSLLTPAESLTGDPLPAAGIRSSIPSVIQGPRPLTEPSSLPAWLAPDLGVDNVPAVDPAVSQPIDVEVTPEIGPRSIAEPEIDLGPTLPGAFPPTDALPEEQTEPTPFPSTIPPERLPATGLEGVKEQ